MKSYKKKEYTLFLILLYTALTFCNPCVNQTLNAIPYPNDCQAFILCWLSRAYLQTCPNDLFFDIKTNNCQPPVATTCCNMTLPLLIIPVFIYQGSTGPSNKIIWPFTYTSVKQTNLTPSTSASAFQPISTFITSSNHHEATTSIISTLWNESNDFNQSSNITFNVTEQTETETTSRLKSTTTMDSGQTNVYTMSSITSSTEFHNKNFNSSSIVSTDISEATTPIVSTMQTDSSDSLSSGFTLNTTRQTELETTTQPTNSTYVTELTQFERSTKNESHTNVQRNPTIVSSTESSNDTPSSTLIISTSTQQSIMPIRSEASFNFTKLIEEDTMISLETSSTDINVITNSVESNLTNVYSTTPIESSTEYSNDIQLVTPSTTNFPSLATFDSTLNPLRIEGLSTNSITTETADTTTFSTIISDSFRTESQKYIEKSTINSSITELDGSSTTSEHATNQYLNTSVSRLPEYSQTAITMGMPSWHTSTDLTENNGYVTQENLSTRVSLDQSYSPPEVSTINSITSSTMLSTDIYSISTTDTFPRKYEIFTESSTLLPLVSSTTNIVTSTKNPYSPTITFTTEFGEPFTATQYSKDETSVKSSSYFTEATIPERVSITTAEYKPTTVTSIPSQFETTKLNLISSSMTISSDVSPTDALQTVPQILSVSTLSPIFSSATNNIMLSSTTEVEELSTIPQFTENLSPDFKNTRENPFSTLETFSKTVLFTNTEHTLTADTSQSSPSQFISTTNAPKSETISILPSSSESTETTKYITMEPETTFVPFLTTVQSSSSGTFTDATESIWDPVTFTLPSSSLNRKATAGYTIITPVRTDLTIISSELNVTNNPRITSTLSTFQPKFTETTKYDIEGPSKIFESLPINTEMKDGTAMTMDSSILTTVPIIYTEKRLQTNSETHKRQSTVPEEIKPTLLLSTTLLSDKSVTSSTDKTTAKPVVTQIVRILPPLPYSPPPCVFATTTPKSTSSEKTLITIPPIVTSTYITPEYFTHPLFSKPVCGFWDKFVFPDESDCNQYHECLFGDIRKVSCRYGYEFNPYALKCMPHLEANCQRRKSFKNIMQLLYYVTKLNLDASGLIEHQEHDQDIDQESETK